MSIMFSYSLARSLISIRKPLRQSLCLRSRTLFTLPNLSPFPSSGSKGPQTYHERKILPYSQKDLYDVVQNIESYPEFIPFCPSTRIVSRSPFTTADGNASATRMQAELTVGFMGMEENYTSVVTCIPHLSVEAVASSTPLFECMVTTWRFQPASTRSPHASHSTTLSDTSATGIPKEPSSSPVHSTGPTMVTLDLSFSFANPLHAAVSSMFFGQVSRMMVSAFEERCLELYGLGRR